MPHRLCPWWAGYLLLIPLRRLRQNPAKLLGPHVREGMTVLEPGPGMGFFTLELARLVGPSGRVVAVDVQDRMLAALRRRAARAGLADRIDARHGSHGHLGVEDMAGRVDFVPAIFMVHEAPDAADFFSQAYRALRPGGRMLVAEPRMHVRAKDFDILVQTAAGVGFLREGIVVFPGARAFLMSKPS
ncbi:MAG: class I SAM-dependent methyltransferase [Candidatus Polarisedimenticolia bacterium]